MKTIARILTAVLLFVSIPVFAGPSIPILQGGVISSATTGGAGLTPTNATNATNATNLVAGGTIASTVGAVTQPVGSSGLNVATTAFVVPGFSHAGSGYEKLPSGLILQWGIVTNGANPTSVTFPITFPNAIFHVTMNAIYPSGSVSDSIVSYGTTGFSFNTAGTLNHFWFAIGI